MFFGSEIIPLPFRKFSEKSSNLVQVVTPYKIIRREPHHFCQWRWRLYCACCKSKPGLEKEQKCILTLLLIVSDPGFLGPICTHPLKMGITGGRFKNWVETSYLVNIDARHKDLQLSDSVTFQVVFEVCMNVRQIRPTFLVLWETVIFLGVKNRVPSSTLKMR